MVKMIVGSKLAAKSRYRTRRLIAGDEVELSPRKARLYRTLGWVDPAPSAPVPARRGPGRPRKETAALPPAPGPAARLSETGADPADMEDLEDLTNAELMALAHKRNLDLPSGYITNDDLIRRLREG